MGHLNKRISKTFENFLLFFVSEKGRFKTSTTIIHLRRVDLATVLSKQLEVTQMLPLRHLPFSSVLTAQLGPSLIFVFSSTEILSIVYVFMHLKPQILPKNTTQYFERQKIVHYNICWQETGCRRMQNKDRFSQIKSIYEKF